jgi:hypothetical protein
MSAGLKATPIGRPQDQRVDEAIEASIRAIGQHGSMAAWQHGSMAAWQYGMAAWRRVGSKDTEDAVGDRDGKQLAAGRWVLRDGGDWVDGQSVSCGSVD